MARDLGWPIPTSSRSGKGWPGQLIEAALGASAASRPEPDFQLIGVELKTIPIDRHGRPRESTYVCSVPLDGESSPSWAHSNVRRKLARVLWVPLLCDDDLTLPARRVGSPLLWSPDPAAEAALRADWEEFMEDIALGRLRAITGRRGTALQLRPKAAHSREREWTTDEDGARVLANPRGFYLRASFTAGLLARHFGP